MAILINNNKREQVVLRAHHTFGRDPEANVTALPQSTVSRSHAIITWDGEFWKIKDTSANGTFVDGVRIPVGAYYPLPDKAKIQFGNPYADSWQLLSNGAPPPCLVPQSDGLPLLELHDVVVLPLGNDEGEEVVVYLSEQGRWVCDAGGETSVLRSGDKVGCGRALWQFIEGGSVTATVLATPEGGENKEDVRFEFQVSRNEEHVQLSIVVNGISYDLGERNHHYMLLLLARRRLKDEEAGVCDQDQGWIQKDLLIKMLGMKEQHINIQIHRFRKQVTELLSTDVALKQVIARRPGELRLAYSDIGIDGGFDAPSLD